MNQNASRALDTELLGSGGDGGAGDQELRTLGNVARALRRAAPIIAAVGFAGGVAAYLASYADDIRYTSVAQVMIDTRVTADTEFAPVVSGLPTSTTTLESELEVLRSLDLVERVVDRFDLEQDPEFGPDPEESEDEGGLDIVGAIRGAVRNVAGLLTGGDDESAVNGSTIVEEPLDVDREMTISNVASQRAIEQVGNMSAVYAVTFRSENPKKAAILANALADEYLNTQTTAKLRSLELSQGWLAERIEELQQELSDLGVRLEQHMLSAPFSLEEIQTVKARRVSGERRLTQSQGALEEVDAAIVQVRAAIGRDDFMAAARAVPEPTATLETAISAAEDGQEGAADRLRDAVTGALDRLEREQESLQTTIEELREEGENLAVLLEEQAERDARTRQIENNIRVTEAIYEDFVSQLSRRTEQDEYLDPDARIISFARPSINPSEPKRKQQAVMGAIAAAFLASLITVLRELLQDRMRTIRDMEETTRLPMIGIIPEVDRKNAPLTTYFQDTSDFAGSLTRFARKLQSSLRAQVSSTSYGIFNTGSRGTGSTTPARRSWIIAGVSSTSGEGQSSSLLMLANSFAASGERVLLIDCDYWDSPFQEELAWRDVRLADVLRGEVRVDDMIVAKGRNNIHLLPALDGGDDPAALLGTQAFRDMLEDLAQRYDVIVMDTAPLLQRIDCAPLFQLVDTTVLFIRWRSTARGTVRSTLTVLQDVGVRPMAVVATRVNVKRAKGYGDETLANASRTLALDR